MKEKYQILDGFWLKILAMLFMTIDHVGVFLNMYLNGNDMMLQVSTVFHCIGRLAFPLFILLLVEGIKHSKNNWLYLLRLGILGTLISVPQIILGYTYDGAILNFENPLIDLVISALTLILLKQKNWKSIFAIFPIAYILICTIIQFVEKGSNVSVIWLPHYARAGYSLFGLSLSLGFYYSNHLARKMAAKISGFSEKYESLPQFQLLINAFMIGALFLINLFIYFSGQIQNNGLYFLDIYGSSTQTWCIFAGLFIFLYSGKKGYNKSWFKYGSYLYFPVHIILIFLIFYILLG